MKWSEVLVRILCCSIYAIWFQFLLDRLHFHFGTMNTNDCRVEERNLIHITGFGAFRGFSEVNPSWEAVSRLPDHIEYNEKELTVVKHKVAVTYDAVDSIVPKLWQTRPLLVVHCGVNYKAKTIHLEQNAFNGNFSQADWEGRHLERTSVCLPNAGESKQLNTTLDLDSIVSTCTDLECSQDPGNYLCGYVYLKSLDFDSKRCLFIHVPPICEKYTVDVIRDAILVVIKKCIEQLRTRNE